MDLTPVRGRQGCQRPYFNSAAVDGLSKEGAGQQLSGSGHVGIHAARPFTPAEPVHIKDIKVYPRILLFMFDFRELTHKSINARGLLSS